MQSIKNGVVFIFALIGFFKIGLASDVSHHNEEQPFEILEQKIAVEELVKSFGYYLIDSSELIEIGVEKANFLFAKMDKFANQYCPDAWSDIKKDKAFWSHAFSMDALSISANIFCPSLSGITLFMQSLVATPLFISNGYNWWSEDHTDLTTKLQYLLNGFHYLCDIGLPIFTSQQNGLAQAALILASTKLAVVVIHRAYQNYYMGYDRELKRD